MCNGLYLVYRFGYGLQPGLSNCIQVTVFFPLDVISLKTFIKESGEQSEKNPQHLQKLLPASQCRLV